MASLNLCNNGTTPSAILEHFIGFVATKHIIGNIRMERGKKFGVQCVEKKSQGTAGYEKKFLRSKV